MAARTNSWFRPPEPGGVAEGDGRLAASQISTHVEAGASPSGHDSPPRIDGQRLTTRVSPPRPVQWPRFTHRVEYPSRSAAAAAAAIECDRRLLPITQVVDRPRQRASASREPGRPRRRRRCSDDGRRGAVEEAVLRSSTARASANVDGSAAVGPDAITSSGSPTTSETIRRDQQPAAERLGQPPALHRRQVLANGVHLDDGRPAPVQGRRHRLLVFERQPGDRGRQQGRPAAGQQADGHVVRPGGAE